MTQAQVTQHLQLEPPTACLDAGYNIPRAAGRQAQGLRSLARPREVQRGRSGMLLPGFQKLLQFLQPQQLLEWTQGSLTPAQTPSQVLTPTRTHAATKGNAFCPWLVSGLGDSGSPQ